jgi:hypothetical protein
MSSIPEILNRLKLSGKLEANDFPHGPAVLTMRDGSHFCWFDAFYINDNTVGHVPTITVFTEHYGYHQFERDMVKFWDGPDHPQSI